MKTLKKAIAGLAIAGVMAFSAVVVSAAPTHAAVFNGSGNAISQWIVLSGLFDNGTFGGSGISGNNAISQWIVLSGLFGF